jgi:hypothetical protein
VVSPRLNLGYTLVKLQHTCRVDKNFISIKSWFRLNLTMVSRIRGLWFHLGYPVGFTLFQLRYTCRVTMILWWYPRILCTKIYVLLELPRVLPLELCCLAAIFFFFKFFILGFVLTPVSNPRLVCSPYPYLHLSYANPAFYP